MICLMLLLAQLCTYPWIAQHPQGRGQGGLRQAQIWAAKWRPNAAERSR